MIRRFIQLITCVVCLVVVTGCNDDIFVKRPDATDNMKIAVEGDGGWWSGPINTKGLKRAYVNYNYDDRQYVQYFGANGGTVDADCEASQLGYIVYETPARFYSIGFEGDMLYFNSDYNALEPFYIDLNLEYEYGVTSHVVFVVDAGKPLICSYYATDAMSLNVEEQFSRRYSFNNISSLQQVMTVSPYEGMHCAIDIIPDDDWVRGLSMEMLLPVYMGDYWGYEMFDDVTVGERLLPSLGDYADEIIKVDVPPYTKATVTYGVHITCATERGVLLFYNLVADRQFEVHCTTKSYYPTDYDYTVAYE